MFGIDDSDLFERYVKGKRKAIFPWSLSIVDCFFVVSAFRSFAIDAPIELTQRFLSKDSVERSIISDAYDLYTIDSNAAGFEVVMTHDESDAVLYWDLHERFVVLAGSDELISIARPFPEDIERHRYVEEMLHLEESENPENPEAVYDELKGMGTINPRP